MRAVHLFLLLGLAASPLLAQTTPPIAPKGNADKREQLPNPEQMQGRNNQRTERIRVEDEGSRVDELRVGGQTQSITVQPKTGDMPEYEVQSPHGARSRAGRRRGAATFDHGLDQGVPRAAFAALARPLGKGRAALGAAVHALGLGHGADSWRKGP